MDALEFMRELKRMCDSYITKRVCNTDCPLHQTQFCTIGHRAKTEKTMTQAIEIVEKWSKDNPNVIDWLKVPRNTPVLVRDIVDREWQEGRFCAYLPYTFETRNQFITFDTEEQYAAEVNYWRHCKLAPEVDPTPYLKEVK